MSGRLEWVHARSTEPRVYGPFEILADGQSPAGTENEDDVIGVGIESAVIYGTPEEVMELLAHISMLVERYTTRRGAPPVGDTPL